MTGRLAGFLFAETCMHNEETLVQMCIIAMIAIGFLVLAIAG